MNSSGKINIKVPKKNTNGGNWNVSEAGYMELKVNAPRKSHTVSRDAMAENIAPENKAM